MCASVGCACFTRHAVNYVMSHDVDAHGILYVILVPSHAISSSHAISCDVTGIQRTMVNTMNAANAVPTFGYSDEIIMDRLASLRDASKKMAEKQGVKLSYMPFLFKAASMALLEYPQLNCHVNADCTQVRRNGMHVHMLSRLISCHLISSHLTCHRMSCRVTSSRLIMSHRLYVKPPTTSASRWTHHVGCSYPTSRMYRI